MSIAIINKSHLDDFIHLCANSRRSIKLCAPFVKADIIAEVIKAKKSEVALSLITKHHIENYKRGASDIQALQQLFEQSLASIQAAFPRSNTHFDTIRRVLQELRDIGLISFLGNGQYQQLWRSSN